MKAVNYLIAITLIWVAPPACGMRALHAKQQEVARESLREARKREGELIPGTKTPLTAAWINDANYYGFNALFDIFNKALNKTLSNEQSTMRVNRRLLELWEYFQKLKQRNCDVQCQDAIDRAITKIETFRDFLLNVRGDSLNAGTLMARVLEYQNKYFEARAAAERNDRSIYKTKKEAENKQRELAFKADLIKEYVQEYERNMHEGFVKPEYANNIRGLTPEIKNFIERFDITRRKRESPFE